MIVFIQVILVIIVSAPSFKNKKRGSRLTRNANLTAVLTCSTAQPGPRGLGARVVSTGKSSREKIIIRLVAIANEGENIAATWICTKSLWFLRPVDKLLSYRSDSSEPWGSTKVTKISSFRYWRVSLGK